MVTSFSVLCMWISFPWECVIMLPIVEKNIPPSLLSPTPLSMLHPRSPNHRVPFEDLYLNQQQSAGFMPYSMSWLPIRWSNSCLSRQGFCHHWGVKCQSRFLLSLSNVGWYSVGHVSALGIASRLNCIIRVDWKLLWWGLTSFLALTMPLQTPSELSII